MQLILLTCASDQHAGFKLACRYVARAVLHASADRVVWIISDDGKRHVDSPQIPGVEVRHLRSRNSRDGLQSFRSNMAAAIQECHAVIDGEDDLIATLEDDWFGAWYLGDAIDAFAKRPELMLFGETRTRYYRLDNRRWHVFNANGRAALSSTVMRPAVLPIIEAWAAGRDQTIMLDDRIWKSPTLRPSQKLLLPESRYVVGIKGLPGKGGLGMGSRLSDRHRHDPDGSVLREWIGDDVSLYESYLPREKAA